MHYITSCITKCKLFKEVILNVLCTLISFKKFKFASNYLLFVLYLSVYLNNKIKNY